MEYQLEIREFKNWGDGKRVESEECDDENTTNGDRCIFQDDASIATQIWVISTQIFHQILTEFIIKKNSIQIF